MIYTSYFDNLKNLPKDITPIAICGRSPDCYKGLEYKKLAPKLGFFQVWEKTHNNYYYVESFNELVLKPLSPKIVYEQLITLSKGNNNIALICYETPEKFCHRHLVRNWFMEAGFLIREF